MVVIVTVIVIMIVVGPTVIVNIVGPALIENGVGFTVTVMVMVAGLEQP